MKILCDNDLFLNIFQYNKDNHYNYNTLKTLYKYKDLYSIRFKLLPINEEYDYNAVIYDETIELKNLLKGWFTIMDTLLTKCDKKNWLLKSYLSQAWGTLTKYKKVYIDEDDANTYDWDHLNNISSNKYEYYAHKHTNGIYTMINADDAFEYKALGRIKPFLTEYSRNYIFDMISSNNLAKYIIRIQTDGVVFNKPIDFKNMNLKYSPIQEDKSTGHIKFYNVNRYVHVCKTCNTEYSYNKLDPHVCSLC